MRVKLAGGVGEHGRNSFLVEGERTSFLVDAGIIEGDDPYPRLTGKEIESLSFLFLTHSHADHSGAIPELLRRGFRGAVVASRETFSQLPFPVPRGILAQDFKAFPVKSGRTGHCIGSLWYLMEFEGMRLFFSGDYLEESTCYEVDRVRDVKADLAILDSAYGSQDGDKLRRDVKELLPCLPTPLALPVPKYGRGFEVLSLLPPESTVYADSHFLGQRELMLKDNYWVKPGFRGKIASYSILPLPEKVPSSGYVFLSDPQLNDRDIFGYASACASVLLTGTVKSGSGSLQLIKEGKAFLSLLPVHSTDKERKDLEKGNRFQISIASHTSEHGQSGHYFCLY